MSDLTPLTGEPLALDLVNTRPTGADLLAAPADLRTWLSLQANRFPQARGFAAVEYTSADLAAVYKVRECTARVLDHARHGTQPPSDDLKALNRAQRAAPAIREVTWNGTAVTATHSRTGPLGTQLTAWLAEAAAELLTDSAVVGIRQCEADDCVMLFLPAHPRRRWCSAARCGNRVRVARHYQRHKPT
ncbi:CGNR zinc finger domain-containing protein [Micromonospora andamanensis]|uniref:CGNR zinc finger domain-containing protein n=1 Tax=Micromonospora andamanensis TaxID=1287068 RepID=UPI00194EBBC2|nr:ABATE domain-containing protein [Micromonospora andamanensis]GIJ41163.1 hypothetical protein Vwe01_44880 [Micromonospora andamanensis]